MAKMFLAVDVDSRERADIPPFGFQIDYLTFGGIYREVSLRIVPGTFIENIFAKPKDVLTPHPSLDVDCFLMHLEASKEPLTLEVDLREGDHVIAKGSQKLPASEIVSEPMAHNVRLENLSGIKLWDLTTPNLYAVHVRVLRGTQLVDRDTRTIGFREASFTDNGFDLNGKSSSCADSTATRPPPYGGGARPLRAQRCQDLFARN